MNNIISAINILNARTNGTQDFDVNNKKLINLGTPAIDSDATNKSYVDNSLLSQWTSVPNFVGQSTPNTTTNTTAVFSANVQGYGGFSTGTSISNIVIPRTGVYKITSIASVIKTTTSGSSGSISVFQNGNSISALDNSFGTTLPFMQVNQPQESQKEFIMKLTQGDILTVSSTGFTSGVQWKSQNLLIEFLNYE